MKKILLNKCPAIFLCAFMLFFVSCETSISDKLGKTAWEYELDGVMCDFYFSLDGRSVYSNNSPGIPLYQMRNGRYCKVAITVGPSMHYDSSQYVEFQLLENGTLEYTQHMNEDETIFICHNISYPEMSCNVSA